MTKTLPLNGMIGSEQIRIDGLPKVTGQALYGADHLLPHPAHAALVTAPIARGRVVSIDESAVRAMPGVLEVLTWRNVGKAVKGGKALLDGGYQAQAHAPLSSNRITFAGQIVAVVIAQTLEEAERAAGELPIEYKASRQAAGRFDDRWARTVKPKALGETELKAGDVDAGFEMSAATVDAWYETPPQHHNPLELFQTTCAWKGDELTVWESSQSVRGFQHGLAQQLGIKPEKVRVISPFVGGAFGSRGELGQYTSLIALAAHRLGRPVKYVATRQQGFTLRTFRAETRHHLRLGADAQGHLLALDHESWEMTGRSERFAVAGSDSTGRLYACPHVRTKVHNVEADRQAPGFMRAPPETPYMFAMESAMDELAYKLGVCPLAMRRRNDTMVETVSGKPYTSRSLVQCIDKGAELFGWDRRDPKPGSMLDGDELVGWGFASAMYPAQMGPAECRVTLHTDGRALVEVGAHEIGTGIRTVAAQTVSDLLGLLLEAVEVRTGDSSLPAAPMAAGSNSTASVCSVLYKACGQLREKLIKGAVRDKRSVLYGAAVEAVTLREGHLVAGDRSETLAVAVRRLGPSLVEHATSSAHGIPPVIGPLLVRRGKPAMMGGSNTKDRMQFAHGAQFVEVRIDRWTGQIRVPRMVGVFAAGRIMNPKTARSQLTGGQIWGASAALFEATEVDPRLKRYVNDNLAEYHVPVCADIGDVQTVMLHEEDTLVNPLGIKGVGELGVTGMNAAIANAVFHATGRRVRKTPIRPEDVLGFA